MAIQEIRLRLSEDIYNWLTNEVNQRGIQLNDVVADILVEYAQSKGIAFDITQTRTWELCGTLELAEPEAKYVVGKDKAGKAVTNYAEHIDDLIYNNA